MLRYPLPPKARGEQPAVPLPACCGTPAALTRRAGRLLHGLEPRDEGAPDWLNDGIAAQGAPDQGNVPGQDARHQRAPHAAVVDGLRAAEAWTGVWAWVCGCG